MVDVNDAFLRVLGFSREEVIGRTSVELGLLLKPGERQRLVQNITEQGAVRDFATTIRCRDGSVRHVVLSSEIIRVGDDECLLTTLLDVTERRLAEQALLESRDQLASVIDGTRAGIWDWNVQTGETGFNERWAEIVGYTLDELQPISIRTWVDLCHPDDLARSNDLLGRHFAGVLDYYDFECRMRHKDGHWVWVHDRGRVVQRDAEGRPWRMTGTHTDISRRKAEEARRLELDRQLLRAQKTESLSRMAGAIAHHFNNKLTTIIGHLEMVRQDTADGTGPIEGVDVALGAAREAAAISRMLLEYLGQGRVRREAVDLSELCLAAVVRSRGATPATIRLVTSGVGEGPVVQVDRAQMLEVLTSLIENSCEAIGEDGGEISLSTGVRDLDAPLEPYVFPNGWRPMGASAFIAVEDTGSGIDMASMNRLFDPFYSTKFIGRGLGLPVALGHLRPYGGAIAVSSQPGRGSTFCVLLPIEADAAPADTPLADVSP